MPLYEKKRTEMLSETCLDWFALRVDFRRETIVKKYFDSIRIENFLPMQYKEVVVRGHKIRKLMPLVHNLIFARTTKQQLDTIKATTVYPIRYLMFREGTKSSPIVVPEEQMQNFIRVAGSYDDQLLYLSPEQVPLTVGDRVRILSGPFAGAEGIYVRLKGTRARRVVVHLPGIMAVATATVPPSMIERIA